MDRALKERIIGAIVLVLFVVLVVPVFLDGPAEEAEVLNERVPLPGQSEQVNKLVVLERDRSEPVPSAANTPEPDAPAATGSEQISGNRPAAVDARPAVIEPEPEPEARAEPEQAAAAPIPERPAPRIQRSTDSATGMWAVQLGSFSSEENANRLAADLRKKGFAAFLSKTEGDGGTLHRVRIGPQKDRATAEAMASRLADAGEKGQVVPHP